MTLSMIPLSQPTQVAPCTERRCLSLVERLRNTFGVPFYRIDPRVEDPVEPAEDDLAWQWSGFASQLRQVSSGSRPKALRCGQAFTLLAVPAARFGAEAALAVGLLPARAVGAGEDLDQAAADLGISPTDALRWAGVHTAWPPDAAERTAQLVVEHLEGTQRAVRLERENESVSQNLASTYEEITLLHRLTQDLRLSKSDEELSRTALEWLGEVIPAEGLAIRLRPVIDEENSLTPNARSRPLLITCGQCPLSQSEFDRLIEYTQVRPTDPPKVINNPNGRLPQWPFEKVRQLIVVPLCESDNLFGWLAAINHLDDNEFGTIEASLLSTVAAILGIHSGNIELYRQQRELLSGIIRALTSAIDAKDPYTCGHSDRVARVAVRLAQELEYPAEALEDLYLSGLLHDIGKIGINDRVLCKPGRLTDEEYEHIKTHVSVGHKILQDLRKLDEVLPVVLHHHESWDGNGYPGRLSLEDIPFSARIVAVADSFDAMASNRPYRRGMSDEKIDQIFHAGAGKQWDPQIVAAFFRARGDLREIASEGNVQAATSTTPAAALLS